MVKVVAIDAPAPREMRRIGFLEKEFREGLIKVPDDLGTMDAEYIEKLFAGEIE